MLKICIFTPFFPRYRRGTMGLGMLEFPECLAKVGQLVYVITASKFMEKRYTNRICVYQLPKIPEGTGRVLLTGVYSFCKALLLYPNVDIIHYQWAAFSPNFFGMIANVFTSEKKPSIVTVRGGDLRSGLKSAARFSLIKTMLKKVDRVVAVSQGMYNLARMYGVPQRKLTIIPNGIDTALFNLRANGSFIRKKFDIGDSPLVVCAGTEKIKGIECLIQAIPKVLNESSDVKFIVIGIDGRRKMELRMLARRLNVNKSTFFVCPAPYHVMPNFFAAADVVATIFSKPVPGGMYILPNEYGRVHLEAMACGKPVITSVAKGLIENGRTGFRVSTNIDEIASTIAGILHDKKLRTQIGRNASKVIMKHFSVEVMTERYLQLYKEVIDI